MKTNKVLATIITLSASAILGSATAQAAPIVQDKLNTSDATVTLDVGDVTI